jgi:hypothetical protein
MRSRQATRALVAAAAAATMLATASPAFGVTTSPDTTQFSVTAGSLAFSTVPDVPNLPGLTLNGQIQTLNAAMNTFGVDDATGSGSGWNVTVSGDNSAGKSAVFKRYCPNATCGPDSGPAYVAGGATLAAGTITLNSTGASFTGLNGTTGTAPTHQCNAGTCAVDAAPASPTKIVSAASSAGMGTWGSTGWSGTSIAASTPSTISALPANEVYRVDLLWTLGSGP